MEFLTTVTTIGAVINAASKVGYFVSRSRKRELRDLKTQYNTLTDQIKYEGKRIQQYIEFNRIVSSFERNINRVLKVNSRNEKEDAKFWDQVEDIQLEINEEATVTLRNFDVGDFSEREQVRIETHNPGLSDLVVASQAYFSSRQRDDYVGKMRESLAKVGQIKGVGSRILNDIGKSLRDFA